MLCPYNHLHIVISHMVRAIITLSSWAELLHQEFSHVRRICLHIPENRMDIGNSVGYQVLTIQGGASHQYTHRR